MINASTAKRESLLNSKALTHMSNIETAIKNSIKEGLMVATVNHGIKESEEQLANAIQNKLIELGYDVDFCFAADLPFGCPSDQWNFNNGHITISWE